MRTRDTVGDASISSNNPENRRPLEFKDISYKHNVDCLAIDSYPAAHKFIGDMSNLILHVGVVTTKSMAFHHCRQQSAVSASTQGRGENQRCRQNIKGCSSADGLKG
jgi:hypothetical protein